MDVQKFIIESLSKSPFNIKYSLNTLSSLKSHELLQLLYNVLIEISGQSKEDTGIEREEPDKIAIGILDTLRILNYKLPVGMDPINFRDGLIAGVSHVIQGVLYWLLSNVESISERAYLAKFLVKLEIPTDFIGNPEIAHLYQQYQQLMDKFKEVHKENCALKSTNKITINELRSDCEAIEKEKEIVSNRLQQLNLKTDGIANKDSILKAAQDLGTQRDRKSNLQHQLEEESSIVQNVNYRIIRTSKHLQDIRDNYPQLSSEALLKKLEEENYVNKYIANEKLPRQILHQTKQLQLLRQISSTNVPKEPNSMIESKIEVLSEQVNKLLSVQLSNNSRSNDDISLFVQQADVIALNKDDMAETYSQLKSKLMTLNVQLEKREEELETLFGRDGIILNREQFQEYANHLRNRSINYKRCKNQLNCLKIEEGVLSRTVDILISKTNDLNTSDMNDEMGVMGVINGHSNLMNLNSKSQEELLELVASLNANISSEKIKLKPLITEIRPLQQESHEITFDYEEKKNVYERTSAALDTNVVKLNREVNTLYEQYVKIHSDNEVILARMNIVNVNFEYFIKEFNSSSMREKLNHKITEGERVGRWLMQEQKLTKDKENNLFKQRQTWNNLLLLLQCKDLCFEMENQPTGILHLDKGAETLILQ